MKAFGKGILFGYNVHRVKRIISTAALFFFLLGMTVPSAASAKKEFIFSVGSGCTPVVIIAGLNLRIFLENVSRPYPRRSILLAGYEQFDYITCIQFQKIIRNPRTYLDTFSYMGLDLSLELIL